MFKTLQKVLCFPCLGIEKQNYYINSRDVRRLVVALSRARLGLYVLGRVSLFQNCLELATAFQRVKIFIF